MKRYHYVESVHKNCLVKLPSPDKVFFFFLWKSEKCVYFLTHFSHGNSQKGKFANNADPDQMPQNVASDQGPHCLHIV